MGKAPGPMPRWLGNVLAWVLTQLGPKVPPVMDAYSTTMSVYVSRQGLEFGRYSLDYHTLRNYLYVQRHMGPARAAKHVPEFAKRVVAEYDARGGVSARCGCGSMDAAAAANRLAMEYDAPRPVARTKKGGAA